MCSPLLVARCTRQCMGHVGMRGDVPAQPQPLHGLWLQLKVEREGAGARDGDNIAKIASLEVIVAWGMHDMSCHVM